jgi:hypothetical protein
MMKDHLVGRAGTVGNVAMHVVRMSTPPTYTTQCFLLLLEKPHGYEYNLSYRTSSQLGPDDLAELMLRFHDT